MTILDELKVLTLDENAKSVTINAFRAGRALVLDFWTTKCVKCPAALEKLNCEANENVDGGLVFAACALSQGTGNKDIVMGMIEDWGLDWSLTHMFMELEDKEKAKAEFGFNSVPFCVVISKSGSILGSGDPKSIDFAKLLSAESKCENIGVSHKDLPVVCATNVQTHTFSLDEDF